MRITGIFMNGPIDGALINLMHLRTLESINNAPSHFKATYIFLPEVQHGKRTKMFNTNINSIVIKISFEMLSDGVCCTSPTVYGKAQESKNCTLFPFSNLTSSSAALYRTNIFIIGDCSPEILYLWLQHQYWVFNLLFSFELNLILELVVIDFCLLYDILVFQVQGVIVGLILQHLDAACRGSIFRTLSSRDLLG